MATQSNLVVVENPSVQTLSVNVKVLSIGKKQMTLAVFRQLPVRDLLDLTKKDLPLNGIPWGLVNYHWSACYACYNSHIHVVWQDHNILYQSPILLNVSNVTLPLVNIAVKDAQDLGFQIKALESVAGCLAARAGFPMSDDNVIDGWHLTGHPAHVASRIALKPILPTAPVSTVVTGYTTMPVPVLMTSYYDRMIVEWAKDAKLELDPPPSNETLRKLFNKLNDAVKEKNTEILSLINAYKTCIQELQTLDQLFIAI